MLLAHVSRNHHLLQLHHGLMSHCLLDQYHLGSNINIGSSKILEMRDCLPSGKSSSEGNLSAMMSVEPKLKESLERRV